MKKSILALGAAVALGGLGFAGSAHALAFFGAGANPTSNATALELNPGGRGHYLFTPYYSAQGTIGTMFSVTNTDPVNGKALKVRFRGAANSDDVLDFTVFLSPLDVWTAGVSKDGQDFALLTTNDKSCTIPKIPAEGVQFKIGRTDSDLGEAERKSHTREGYIEVLNMADVLPGTALFTNIKHVNGVAPCLTPVFATVSNTTVAADAGVMEAAGLGAPSGQLMGSWAVMNQEELAVYGGAQTAVQAVATPSTPAVPATNGLGFISFAPQMGSAIGAALDVNEVTADPLLRAGKVMPLWFDLPDMSTPYTTAVSPVDATSPIKQANALSIALGKGAIMNDYAANGDDASIPMSTDWVVSQPTRRYHAAVDYSATSNATAILWNPNMVTGVGQPVTTAPAVADNTYGNLALSTRGNMGRYACLTGAVGGVDREETEAQGAGTDFSPGTITTASFCGEVFTLSFNRPTSQVLQAQVANTPSGQMPGTEGWASLNLDGGAVLPIVGFAATSIKNTNKFGNFGLTLPHRW